MVSKKFHQDDNEYFSADRFEPTNKFNPCPVCNDISGGCRITKGSLILCTRLEGYQPGFAFRGKSRHGIYSKYYPVPSFVDWEEEASKIDWWAADKEDVENLALPGDEPHLKGGYWNSSDANYGEDYNS